MPRSRGGVPPLSAQGALAELEPIDAPLSAYEVPTLARLHATARAFADGGYGNEPDALVLYLHSKGVGACPRGDSSARDDWRRFMLHRLAERPCACIARLAPVTVAHGADVPLRATCGVDLWEWPHLHYSGNSGGRGGAATLPPPGTRVDVAAHPNFFGSPRHGSEFWLGGGVGGA